jgi:anti-sigma regulatory factor (Ser/Thr protein kinase)
VPPSTSYPSPQLLCGADADAAHWLELPARWASVGEARSTTDAWLRSWRLPEDDCENAILVLSELTTNAIRHTPSDLILCCVSLTAARRVHLEVHDQGLETGGLLPRCPGEDDEGGRGLLLVQHLAERWGVVRSALTGGNAVWATLGAAVCF